MPHVSREVLPCKNCLQPPVVSKSQAKTAILLLVMSGMGFKPLTHAASKWTLLLLICDVPIIGGCEQVVKGRTTVATCGIPSTQKGDIACSAALPFW